ncbi:2-hydroxyacid dehydrogenase [Caldimonas mangrovi]|uniref:2-hydroxyacid dehydrogenase n=1 Tax=Caldimonas mangrovi TaxID=2944811 RepID=UPI00247728F5|nr:glyoxylate/hydroxypyruvate reductase A [Caldimonas mangrovi]
MSLLLAGRFEPVEREAWCTELRRALPDETLTVWQPGLPAGLRVAVDVAVVANPPPGSLQGLPKLRLVQSLWAGVERLLADPELPAAVPLARMVDPAMSEAMAETALWAVLSLHRCWFERLDAQPRGQWAPHSPQRRADEVVIGVLGLGELGRTVALRLQANGYRVLAWSRRAKVLEGVETLHGDTGCDALLAQAEIVINLLPLTPLTRDFFCARTFARMRPGASLVNLARGAHVVDEDLLAALDRGVLHRAVLDVFRTEPLPPGHPFWRHPRVTVLPHVAAQTDPRTAAAVVADNVHALRAGRPLRHLVDRGAGY